MRTGWRSWASTCSCRASSTCSASGTNHIGQGADLQAKHGDSEFLGKMDEAWQHLIRRMGSDPARTACIGHCMGGRLLIPFAANHPTVKGIVLYYPSVRD